MTDRRSRARAAGVLVAGRGVVAGYAAAELLGASSALAVVRAATLWARVSA